MTELRAAYAALLLWMPASMRVLIVAALTLLIVTKLVPRLLFAAGLLIRKAIPAGCELLLLPEYVATRLTRRFFAKPVPGADVYGQVLGAVAHSAETLGSGVEKIFTRTFKFPRRTALVGSLVVLILWFWAPSLALPGTPGRLIASWNADIRRIDRWLATGQWEVAATPTPRKSPAPKKATPTPSKKPKKK